ncbi:MAG: hypothetical protein ACR2JB_23850 [Bryobacteraceae bacterium]
MTTGLLDRLRKTRLRTLRWIAALALGTMFCAFQICGLIGIRINTSPSLPLGLYQASSDPNANLVEFCPAEPSAPLPLRAATVARAYARMGRLHCSNPSWLGRAMWLSYHVKALR